MKRFVEQVKEQLSLECVIKFTASVGHSGAHWYLSNINYNDNEIIERHHLICILGLRPFLIVSVADPADILGRPVVFISYLHPCPNNSSPTVSIPDLTVWLLAKYVLQSMSYNCMSYNCMSYKVCPTKYVLQSGLTIVGHIPAQTQIKVWRKGCDSIDAKKTWTPEQAQGAHNTCIRNLNLKRTCKDTPFSPVVQRRACLYTVCYVNMEGNSCSSEIRENRTLIFVYWRPETETIRE